MAITYQPSESGRYKVELLKAFVRRGFTYKPGSAITVKQEVLDEMIAAEVVGNVNAAD